MAQRPVHLRRPAAGAVPQSQPQTLPPVDGAVVRPEHPAPESASGPGMLSMQRAAGNQAVAGLIRHGTDPGTSAAAEQSATVPVQRFRWPWESKPDPDAEKARIRRLLINPEVSADPVLAVIDDVDVDVLATINEFTSPDRIGPLAGSEQGRRVLGRVADRFGKDRNWELQARITEILDRHKATEEDTGHLSETSRQGIDALNRAIEGEDDFLKMLYNDWLKLPVRPYRSGAEEDGGVYFDPSLSDERAAIGGGTRTALGKTDVVEWQAEPEAGVPDPHTPLIYIRFGPSILDGLRAATTMPEITAAMAYVRSVIYHEFQHFLDGRKLRDPDIPIEERQKRTLETNTETRAYASQLWRYYDQLAEPAVRNLLSGLAQTFGSADDDVKAQTVKLLAAAVGARDLPGTLAHEEFLRTLAQLSDAEQKVLAPLRDEVASIAKQIEGKERMAKSLSGDR